MYIRILRYNAYNGKTYFSQCEIKKITPCYIYNVYHRRYNRIDLNRIINIYRNEFRIYSIDLTKVQMYEMMSEYFHSHANRVLASIDDQ